MSDSTAAAWGEMRCPGCAARGFYSRPLLRYALGSLSSDGKIVVRCKDCKTFQELTAKNQHCDGVTTFIVPKR